MLQATEEIDPFERYWLFVWKLVACMVRWIYFASGLLNQCQNSEQYMDFECTNLLIYVITLNEKKNIVFGS